MTPPPAPRRGEPPPLLKALERNDFTEVRLCLNAAADAARFPFWDHDVEPPLCAAVRMGCDQCIIQALLECGADLEAMDSSGRRPDQILATRSSALREPFFCTGPFFLHFETAFEN